MSQLIRLKCIAEGSRLRMRIMSPGYNGMANCQCPRNIRVKNREYVVPQSAITLQRVRGSFFYRIKGDEIMVNDGLVDFSESKEIHIKIYDTGSDDCSICMDAEKTIVFAPCGHFCSCRDCATHIFHSQKPKCPMCRTNICELVNKEDVK